MSTEIWEELSGLRRAHVATAREQRELAGDLALRVEDLEITVEEMAQTIESLTALVARAIPQAA